MQCCDLVARCHGSATTIKGKFPAKLPVQVAQPVHSIKVDGSNDRMVIECLIQAQELLYALLDVDVELLPQSSIVNITKSITLERVLAFSTATYPTSAVLPFHSSVSRPSVHPSCHENVTDTGRDFAKKKTCNLGNTIGHPPGFFAYEPACKLPSEESEVVEFIIALHNALVYDFLQAVRVFPGA